MTKNPLFAMFSILDLWSSHVKIEGGILVDHQGIVSWSHECKNIGSMD